VTAVAMHGVSVSTGWFALIMMLAWIGAACLIVFAFFCVWARWMRRRDERARQRRGTARPGPLPAEVARSFREPHQRLPDSGVSDEQLEAWYAQPAREPRR
jgi:hypothetical protein